MRIVITGASGNIGTALLRRLRPAGHTLTGVVRRPPEPAQGVSWIGLDLAEPAATSQLTTIFEGADVVVHLAWGFQPSHRERYLEAVGVGGTRRVTLAAAAAGVPHLVHMSSVGAYSPRLDLAPVDESWPVLGVESSPYSRFKAAAEKIVSQFARDHRDRVVTVLRPGIVGHRTAGSALLRYGLPGLLPARAINAVRLVPLPRGLAIPVVHSDDVGAAIELAIHDRVPGVYNLAAHDPVTTADIATALQARAVPVPAGLLRAAVAGSWKAGLQPMDPGWLDLAMNVPLLDTSHAASELGWKPTVAAAHVLYETVNGIRRAVSGSTPPLRARTVRQALRDAVAHGPVSHRRLP